MYYVGYTALIWAAKGGHTDIARLLVERKADLNSQGPYGIEIESAIHDHTCWMLQRR